MATDMREYLFFTGTNKQGEDLGKLIEENEGDIFSALVAMASLYSEAASRCMALATAVQGNYVDIEAEGHTISVLAAPEAVDSLVASGFVEEDETEEEYYDEDDNICWSDDYDDSCEDELDA